MTCAAPVAALGAPPDAQVDARVAIDPRDVDGGDIAGHFVGISVEWTLTDRYMGPNSRPGFANLLRNLGSGVLRIGGSSQDQVPFDATAPDSDRFVTPDDLADPRDARSRRLGRAWDAGVGNRARHRDGARDSGVSLAQRRPGFGVRPRGRGTGLRRYAGRRQVAGISLGNEPDLTYSGDLARYLAEFPAYADAEALKEWPRVMPATSENIGSWSDLKQPPTGFNTRWFWNWPEILDAVAPTLKERPGRSNRRRPTTSTHGASLLGKHAVPLSLDRAPA